MKKTGLIALILLMFGTLFFFESVYADELNSDFRDALILPVSLQEIEEEAFFGTSAQIVVIPEGFPELKNKALEGMKRLTDLYIPQSTINISDTAFSVNQFLTIHGVNHSYSEAWAKRHQIPFIADYAYYTIECGERIKKASGILHNCAPDVIKCPKIIVVHERGQDDGKSKRPQERSELNPIDYRFP